MTDTVEEKIDQLLAVLAMKGVFVPIVCEQKRPYSQKVTDPDSAHQAILSLFPEIEQWQQETLVMLCLDTNSKVVWHGAVFVGSLNVSIAAPREVYRRAILENASTVILAHNHPSGSLQPSAEDLNTTRQMVQAGCLMGISLLDHLTIGEDGDDRYYSFHESNDELWDGNILARL